MSKEESDLHAEFEMVADHIRTIAIAMITEHFGERCKYYQPNCIPCQRWKLLDKLTENPYVD